MACSLCSFWARDGAAVASVFGASVVGAGAVVFGASVVGAVGAAASVFGASVVGAVGAGASVFGASAVGAVGAGAEAEAVESPPGKAPTSLFIGATVIVEPATAF